MRDALQEDDDDAMLGEIPLVSQNPSISHTFALPESTSPAMDATFYYVLCTMSLMAAAFGNFLIVSLSSVAHLPIFLRYKLLSCDTSRSLSPSCKANMDQLKDPNPDFSYRVTIRKPILSITGQIHFQ
jgi:hypothetical protein